MSKFLDRLEQINLGISTSMGFGAPRAQKPPGMALVGLVSGNHSEGIQTLTDLAPDATLVSGIDDPSVVKDLGQALGTDIPWGPRLSSLNEKEAQTFEDGGCDLLAFPLEGTTVTALASEEIARVLCIGMDIYSDQLRVIDTLPVDVLLLPMSDIAAPWTLLDLAAIGRISRRVNQYILVEASQLPGYKELEALRNIGVHGLVVNVATVEPQKLAELKTAMQDMPRQRSDRRDRVTAVVPSSAFPGGFSPEREEPEPEEDD
jgi:hypothetical protein